MRQAQQANEETLVTKYKDTWSGRLTTNKKAMQMAMLQLKSEMGITTAFRAICSKDPTLLRAP